MLPPRRESNHLEGIDDDTEDGEGVVVEQGVLQGLAMAYLLKQLSHENLG